MKKSKTDFTQPLSGESEESLAYQEVLDYLIETGRYPDPAQADNDASERVQFCEAMDLYANDERLKNASAQQRKMHALIHSNKLYDVIAKNGGYLPVSKKTKPVAPLPEAEEDEILPALYPDPDYDPGDDLYDVSIDRDLPDDAPAAVEPVNDTAIPETENVFLNLILYLSTTAGFVAILLTASRFYLGNDDLFQITKYGFLQFIVLLLVSVAFAEVSGRQMTRLRYMSSYAFLLTTATLSGLLFLQPSWAETASSFHVETAGMLVNFIIDKLLAIGPFRLGVFFAVTALILLITTWFARQNINHD
jgi:hypothetical protein